VGEACGTHGLGGESEQGFGGKVRRKETSWKTEAQMLGWVQNVSWGDWLGVY
jgi:hypothetical protein